MSRLFSWALNLAYLCVLLVAAPWVGWNAWRKGKHREGFAAKLLGRVPSRQGDKPCVWLHAVSVGEVNLLAGTLRELSQRRPELELVISTTTKTGYELATSKYPERQVFYCPLDFSWAVDEALRRVRPELLVLAELELWPNLIRAARRGGVRVAVINGRLSDNSYRGYRRARWLIARILGKIDLIAAQDHDTAERFRSLGASEASVRVTGSLKFDGVQSDRRNRRTLQLTRLAGIGDDEVVLLAGSTQSPEEQYALDVFRQLADDYPALRLIIVPRHPERFDEAARLLDRSDVRWRRRSDLDDAVLATVEGDAPWQVLLVDAVGELGAWWGAATIGFVGGSFGARGGQNMLEPAAYGAAVCFGPNTWNFRDIVRQLLAADAAEVVADQSELDGFVRRCLDDPQRAAMLGERAKQLVASQQGATAVTVEQLTQLLSTTAPTAINEDAAHAA